MHFGTITTNKYKYFTTSDLSILVLILIIYLIYCVSFFFFLYRVESAHSKLKRHLRLSQGNFETSWSIIHNLLELQHKDKKHLSRKA